MKGVVVRNIKLVSNDKRRNIYEVFNGETSIKNMKVLVVKKGRQLLGNHWHPYAEVMHVMKGSSNYRMKNLDTGEVEDFELIEGDVVFRTARIVHAGWFEEGSIIIDAACEPYISAEFNDIREVILE